jgi:hypothetical protein
MFLYIDAGSGGMVLQVLLSGFVGGFVIIKLFWRNLVNTVLRRKDTTELQPEDAASETAAPNA